MTQQPFCFSTEFPPVENSPVEQPLSFLWNNLKYNVLETSVVARVYERYKQNSTEKDAVDHVCKLKMHFPSLANANVFSFVTMHSTTTNAVLYIDDGVHQNQDSFQMHAV